MGTMSRITVCDINNSMLEVGKERAQQRGYMILDEPEDVPGMPHGDGVQLEFVKGDAEKLSFSAESFDAYTIAFGLRSGCVAAKCRLNFPYGQECDEY